VFTSVASSVLTLYIYAGDPRIDGFKQDKVVYQMNPNLLTTSQTHNFYAEGVLLEPLSWASWDILAEDVFIDDLR
jgi:hypothetical protein